MKIRNHRKREWWFYPYEDSKLNRDRCYKFKYKSHLTKFLNKNINECINGTVSLYENCFGASYTLRKWYVWYNETEYRSGSDLCIDLRQLDFRGRKYLSRPHKISKSSKKYFAFSDKVISLMSNIEDKDGNILSKDANKLIILFKKRGFKDFKPNEEELNYINHYISDGIPFSYWSDRCNWLRTKTIIEYFKAKNLI